MVCKEIVIWSYREAVRPNYASYRAELLTQASWRPSWAVLKIWARYLLRKCSNLSNQGGRNRYDGGTGTLWPGTKGTAAWHPLNVLWDCSNPPHQMLNSVLNIFHASKLSSELSIVLKNRVPQRNSDLDFRTGTTLVRNVPIRKSLRPPYFLHTPVKLCSAPDTLSNAPSIDGVWVSDSFWMLSCSPPKMTTFSKKFFTKFPVAPKPLLRSLSTVAHMKDLFETHLFYRLFFESPWEHAQKSTQKFSFH